MKILGYDIRPIHALYAGALTALAAAAPGCGSKGVDVNDIGTKMLYDQCNSEAKTALNNAFHSRLQHKRCKCKEQELSAILLEAAYADGNPSNEITFAEIKFLVEQELAANRKLYEGQLFAPETEKKAEKKE